MYEQGIAYLHLPNTFLRRNKGLPTEVTSPYVVKILVFNAEQVQVSCQLVQISDPNSMNPSSCLLKQPY